LYQLLAIHKTRNTFYLKAKKRLFADNTLPNMALGMITIIHIVLAILVIIELGLTGYRKYTAHINHSLLAYLD
jgi:hypothetical protein